MKHFPRIRLDPRTKLLLLLLANVLLFNRNTAGAAPVFTGFLALLFLLSGCFKSLMIFGICGLGLFVTSVFVLPHAPVWISFLSILVNYTLKMLPCMMAGVFLIRTTPFHDIVLAMRKCRLPQNLIISLSVTVRYFPALFQEIRHIRNAMKFKRIPLSRRLESFLIPLMTVASNTAEELSAAAVSRGIENPVKKTGIRELRFTIMDLSVTTLGFFLIFL